MRAAIYARVSTIDQTCENQLIEIRNYVKARNWTVYAEYIDQGVSGSKDRRPALDRMIVDAKRRRFDVLVCWRLDRLGRNLKHLITLLEDLQALGAAFVSLAEGIDATTPAGKLQMHILGAIAEFERARIQERVRAGLARARSQGVKLGRPRRRIDPERLTGVVGLPMREAARQLGIPRSTLQRFITQKPQ
jgi:DNA invertase Pin-like site-specific DNA recombinase